VNGTIAEKDLPYQLNIPRQDVRLQLGSLFNEALASEGIQIKNSRDDQSWSQREAVFYSVPLRDLLKPLLKNSINLLGDSLAKAIGQKLKPGSQDVHSAGVEFILAFAVRESQDSRTELFDGSGMSRRSSVSPRGMISYLQALLSKPYFPEIWNALSVAGVDGTLTNRMKGTIAEGFVRGKTGTLRGSYTIAGYIPKLGQLVPYVLLAKTDAKFSGAARLIQDRFLIRASHTYRGPFSPLPVGEYGVDPFPYYPDHAGLDGEN
jgi:PBP4 family serine-type D-alanyl-D-alanine carboxypeptidase